jgi:hypothetical protein
METKLFTKDGKEEIDPQTVFMQDDKDDDMDDDDDDETSYEDY